MMPYKTAFLAVMFAVLTLMGGDTYAGTRQSQTWFQICTGETAITAQWFIATEGIRDSFGQVMFPAQVYTFNITCRSHTGQNSVANTNNFPAIPYEAGNVVKVNINMIVVNTKTDERTYDTINTTSNAGTYYPTQLSSIGGFGQIGFGIADVNP